MKIWTIIGCVSCVCVSGFVYSQAPGKPTEAKPVMKANAEAAVFDKDGSLLRPKGYRRWIFIGTPLTPNDMNAGHAAFPEFHNVYIDPASYDEYLKTGNFRDGAIIVKELVSVGSKSASSGKGYFEGEFIGLEASVKSKKHAPKEPGNWAYYRFTTEEGKPLLDSAKLQPSANCNSCHTGAADDYVFTEYYPVLRAAKGKGIDPDK